MLVFTVVCWSKGMNASLWVSRYLSYGHHHHHHHPPLPPPPHHYTNSNNVNAFAAAFMPGYVIFPHRLSHLIFLTIL